jgi:hypothetical protein
MTDRRTRIDPELEPAGQAESHEPGFRHRHISSVGLTGRLARPRSLAEAEERYVAARDEWAAAMRGALTGRPADLAALAIAQEAYEAAMAERDRWQHHPKVAIPVEPDRAKDLEAIVGQEMTRRQVHEHEAEGEQPRGLRRFFRRAPKR